RCNFFFPETHGGMRAEGIAELREPAALGPGEPAVWSGHFDAAGINIDSLGKTNIGRGAFESRELELEPARIVHFGLIGSRDPLAARLAEPAVKRRDQAHVALVAHDAQARVGI